MAFFPEIDDNYLLLMAHKITLIISLLLTFFDLFSLYTPEGKKQMDG